MKYLVTVAVTYLLIKVIYWLLNFSPFQEFSFFVALLIDLSIWIFLYYLILKATENLFKTK